MKKKKLLSIILVAVMALSLAACGSSSSDESSDTSADTADADDSTEELSYEEESEAIYDAALASFEEMYYAATEAETTSERYALMAVAEAYLLESGVTLPLYTEGGRYAISRVAPYTNSTTMWGLDNYRYDSLVVTTELITADDIAALREEYSELAGTGTYLDYVKEYLTDAGYELTDTYNVTYNADPATWDTLSTSLSTDCEPAALTYDSLMEYDAENVLQPALAESYEVSDDGLTYTFYIREGVSWVDSQGREVGTVTADDFVAGFQHMLDAQGGLEYLVDGLVVGASEYISGEITDFSEVGVEAVDDYTLVYTLTEECSYFLTMLPYSVFAPLNRDFYESCGGKFGVEYDPSASDYTYGSDPDNIAYCGPYIVTNFTAANKIVFSQNESYWNIDEVNITTVNWLYDDGSDPTSAYNNCIDGTISGVTLTTSTIEVAQSDGVFDTYAYTTLTNGATYQSFANLNRAAFANTNDETTVVSDQTDEDAERTNAAMNNQHFRLALCYGLDRTSYHAQSVGDELASGSLRNTITPGTFVALEEDVTIDINGTETTFEAGTYYGEIVQAQIDADGYPITVWDPDANDGVGSSDGFDGWYDVDNALAELELAIEELAEEGITIDEDNPIYIDLPTCTAVETYYNNANAYKQSIEASLNGLVIVNLVECTSVDEWLYAGYYTSYGYEMNYDLYDLSGWLPDYGDPDTYLNCFLPDYIGYMTKCLGVY